jgi:hypothetical protein
MNPHTLDTQLLARFKYAVEAIEERAGDLFSSDESVAKDTREWLDDEDAPLTRQNPQGITSDEYFFITTLYGNMNLEAQRNMIRRFFGSLFIQAAKRDVRNFRQDQVSLKRRGSDEIVPNLHQHEVGSCFV